MNLMFMTWLASSQADAAPTRGFRIQGCVGLDSTCVFLGGKVGYTYDYVGINLADF